MNLEDKRTLRIQQIEEYRASGLKAAEWCEQNQLSIHALRYWIRKMNQEQTEVTCTETQWLAVPEGPDFQPITKNPLVLTIGDVSIQVPAHFHPETLEQVIRIVRLTC